MSRLRCAVPFRRNLRSIELRVCCVCFNIRRMVDRCMVDEWLLKEATHKESNVATTAAGRHHSLCGSR